MESKMAEKRPYFDLMQPSNGYTAEGLRDFYGCEKNKKKNDHAVVGQQIDDLEADKPTNEGTKRIIIENSRRKLDSQLCDKILSALEANPEQLTTLMSFKDSIDEKGKDVVETKLDLDSEPFKLKVDLKSVGTELEVVDGKVYFDTEGMDAKKMHDTIAFLEQHCLVEQSKNLKIKDADEQTLACFDEAKEMFEEESYGPPQIVGIGDIPPENLEALRSQEIASADESNDDDNSNGNTENQVNDNSNAGYQGFAAGNVEPSNNEPSPKDVLKAANKSVEGWCNRNKRRNYSWFKGTSVLGGWDTYTIYPGEDRNQNWKPVTKDKHGRIKVNYEFKVYTRMRNGKLEVCYTCPPGKNLTDDQADLIAGIFEDAGIKYVDFKAMTNPNQAVMRTACAKKLLVPTSHKLDQERFDKMMDAAGKKNDSNSPKLYAYKKDLALQMGEYLRNEKGIDWQDVKNKNNPSCRRIRWAIGAYELHPFRDLWEDFGLRGEYEKRLAAGSPSDPHCTDAENGAVKVIGAKMAVYSLFEMFRDNASKDVRHLLGQLTGEEKAALSGLPLNTKVRDMPKESLLAIYSAMCKTQEGVVKNDLEEEYLNIARRNHENGSKDDPEAGALNVMFSRANTMITSLNEELADCNLPQIYLARKDTPKYDFTAARKEASEKGYVRDKAGGNKRSTPDGSRKRRRLTPQRTYG